MHHNRNHIGQAFFFANILPMRWLALFIEEQDLCYTTTMLSVTRCCNRIWNRGLSVLLPLWLISGLSGLLVFTGHWARRWFKNSILQNQYNQCSQFLHKHRTKWEFKCTCKCTCKCRRRIKNRFSCKMRENRAVIAVIHICSCQERLMSPRLKRNIRKSFWHANKTARVNVEENIVQIRREKRRLWRIRWNEPDHNALTVVSLINTQKIWNKKTAASFSSVQIQHRYSAPDSPSFAFCRVYNQTVCGREITPEAWRRTRQLVLQIRRGSLRLMGMTWGWAWCSQDTVFIFTRWWLCYSSRNLLPFMPTFWGLQETPTQNRTPFHILIVK